MNRSLFRISPCLLAAVFCLVAMIAGYADMEKSGGWSYLAVIIFGPVLLICIVVDVIIKLIFKQKFYWVWIVEIIVLVIIYFAGIRRHMF